jgi:hypothetical protein
MTDILIDRSRGAGGKKHNLHRCFYCDHSKYPQGKVIMPHDKHARKTDKGDFICGICNLELNQKLIEGMSRRIGILANKEE